IQTGKSLRCLFVVILRYCNPSHPEHLWEAWRHKICDDLRRQLSHIPHYQDRQFEDHQIYDYGLYLLNKILMEFGDDLTKHPNMPLPNGPDDNGRQWLDLANNPMLASQLAYDHEELQNRVDRNYQQFNYEQKTVHDAVMESVNSGNSRMFFIHSAGGCGKTYLCNTITAAVRAQGHIALCVASSGIAALLLEGGRTAHSRFKIPIPVHEDSVAGITRRSQMYEVLCHTKVIIWDEVPMQHKHGILAVDKCLRDLLDKRDCPFGGITVVFGGDFRQTLPVVPKGSRQDIIDASLC
ncbi:ATP-dependent DNA helicase pif1, partial [Leucoagaricus sp. SymC.cos]